MKTRATTGRGKLQSPVKLNGVIPMTIETRNIRASPVENDTSPVRRQKRIAKTQDERFKLITKALNGYSEDLEKLFCVATWKDLIRTAKKGSPDERRFNNDANLKTLANNIIEQIASNEYSSKVAQILSAPSARRGRTSPNNTERATRFLLLAVEFDKKQDDLVRKKITGGSISEDERDDYGDEDSETTSVISNSHSEDPLPVENRCLIMDLEVEGEKENASSKNKRQTRNSTKAQQSPLRVKSSQPLENCRSNGLTNTKAKSVNLQPTISIPKDDFECRSAIDDNLEQIKTTSRRSPLFLNSPDDEVIENDTPPPTPINGIEHDVPIPRKRTRFNSSSRDFDRSPSIGRNRSYGRNDISYRSMDLDESPRGSRTIGGGDTGMISKLNSFYDYPAGSSNNCAVIDKDFGHDDLPDLEPPDTGRDKENLPKSDQEILRDYPRPQNGPELYFRMFEEIEEALSRPKKDKIVSAYGLTLMQEQLAVYNKSEWLEDANIDFYLEMIKHRNNREGSQYPSVYIFQSYFYKLLDKRGYESVQGATGKDNIFQFDLVLIPIHSDHHWVLVVVDFNEKTMMCYDSMDHDNEKHLRIIAGYLKREWKELKPSRVTQGQRDGRSSTSLVNLNCINDDDEPWGNYLGEGWIIKNLGADDIPQQKNGRDCGVFCLQFAEYLSRRQNFDFEQKHTAYFRKRMLYETLKKTLLIS